MSNIKRKHIKTRGVQPEVVELYKNKEFITDSLSTISVSSIRFSADGQRTTHVLGNICDAGNLQAELKLPELQERCAIATNKNLYELSQQLADPEPTKSGNDTEVPTLEEAHEAKVQRKLHKMPWRRNEHTESDHRRKLKKKASRKLQSILFMQTQTSRDLPSILAMESQEIGDAASSRSKKKPKRKKVPTKSSDSEFATSTMTVIDEVPTPPTTPPPPPPYPEECRAEVSPTELQSMYCAEMQQLISDWSELSEPQTTPQYNVASITYQFLHDKYQEELQFIKEAIKTIDHWHAFSLLLFMGTFCYLLYILLYDINEYINEEVRYRQKMMNAGFVLRCFYYVMRLLKVPIF